MTAALALLVWWTALAAFFLVLALASRPSGFEAALARARGPRDDAGGSTGFGEALARVLELVYERGARLVPVAAVWDTGRFRILEEVGGRLSPRAFCALQAVGAGLAVPLLFLVLFGKKLFLGLAGFLAAAALGLGPSLLVRSEAAKQRSVMAREALVLAEFTSVGVAAGLAPWEALREALRGGDGPLFRKVRYALAEGESTVGRRRRTESLAALAERLEVPEFTSFVELFSQAVEYGAEGFVKAVEDTVRHIRELRKAKLEDTAQKAQSKMMMPLMLFLGSLMAFLMGPMVMQVLSVF